MNVLKKFLSKFFSCYCWVGILFILISIIINLAYPEQPFIIKVLMELLNTIGISISVAALFTWATDSVAFLQKVQELLKSVVIDRSFLRNLDFKSKSDVLELLIKPSNFEKSIYTNIDDYYNFYIKHTLEISQKMFEAIIMLMQGFILIIYEIK